MKTSRHGVGCIALFHAAALFELTRHPEPRRPHTKHGMLRDSCRQEGTRSRPTKGGCGPDLRDGALPRPTRGKVTPADAMGGKDPSKKSEVLSGGEATTTEKGDITLADWKGRDLGLVFDNSDVHHKQASRFALSLLHMHQQLKTKNEARHKLALRNEARHVRERRRDLMS